MKMKWDKRVEQPVFGRPNSPVELLRFKARRDVPVVSIRISNGAALSLGEWGTHSAALGESLLDEDMQPGEQVGLVLDRRDSIDFAIAYFGTMRTGAVPVCVESHPGRIAHRLRRAEVERCVVGERVERCGKSWAMIGELLGAAGAGGYVHPTFPRCAAQGL
ncbi:AMP-binding protein [Streptomyces sp. NPDC051658]|uniref:AMP-binding protein n=1 Tax=Streptomyces sp. NPDC051658 TaxID=3365667 RepID=UPI0037B93A87